MDLERQRRVAEAVLIKRALGCVALVMVFASAEAVAQKFFRDDPIQREPTPVPAVDPGTRNFSLLLEAVSASLSRRGERHPVGGVIEAEGVNTLGEVPDGAWFVNRHGRTPMSADELRRGSGGDPPSANGPLRVVLVKDTGVRQFILARDDQNRLYGLRFDPQEAPELATGAEMVGSRFFHALGYYVPETHLVTIDRARLVPDQNASDVTSFGQLRDLLPKDIDRFLDGVARRPDGRYRALALRMPTEGQILIGPYQFYGTRSDDPNDTVPHEHRRDLRGLYVFSAWLNHTRVGPINTIDVIVQPKGEPLHVRHHLLDFMATLGSGIDGPKPSWEGRDPYYGQASTLQNIAGFGFYTHAWMRASYPDLPAVGRFDAATFDADKWTPRYELAPFANRLPDDTFWAARLVMAFTDADIRAIVETGEYSDPKAASWIADCLIERRNRIGRTYFARVLPLSGFAVRDGALAFDDLAARYRFAGPRAYRADWSIFDNASAKPAKHLGASDDAARIPSDALNVADGSYEVARVTAAEAAPGMAVNVYLRKETGSLRVVGLEWEWPGRKLVDRRIVDRPVRNRYLELEPERKKLFDSYAETVNAKSNERLSPDARFTALTVSEQTTFDAVTHALMRSSLSDDSGQSLGKALDLVTGVEHIAGQEAGRAGDQQFRLYVTLRPDARDMLERSREFVRSEENTVYHAGYPHSWRSSTGVPSAQFSVSEDGLRADIDVDYRGSKAPQSLFNGHMTSSNSDVRAGDNAKRHNQQWNGFVSWWTERFGKMKFPDRAEAAEGAMGAAPTRTPIPLPTNRPINAAIPEVADAVQEFLTDWVIRHNYQEALAFLAPPAFKCVAESTGTSPTSSEADLKRAGLRLLESSAKLWGRPNNLSEAMNPVLPWSPAVRVIQHAFAQDFAIVEAPTELGAQYECGATPPKKFEPSKTPEYGTYYGAILQVVQEGKTGGTLILVWKRVDTQWRIVAYRAVD